MKISKKDLVKENKYLKDTIAVIEDIISEKNSHIENQIENVIETKKYVWKNKSMFDETERLSEMCNAEAEVDILNLNMKEVDKLKKSLITPYFGRVDFKSKDFKDSIYIGINGIEKDYKFYVFDWRSPIASLFYDYEIGSAFYEAPVGKISGEVTLKRQYKIKNKTIEYCFGSTININDEFLQQILANSSSDKMTNIVSTIQKEQNAVIRNVSDKYLVVQGIAGSGKTSVALHRIAYLLYKNKDLNSKNVLIFSPNEIFSEYIIDVLPELGEENVLHTTFDELVNMYFNEYDKIENYSMFLERCYNRTDFNDECFDLIKYKLSNSFIKLVDDFVDDFVKNLKFIKKLSVKNIILNDNILNNLFHNKYRNLCLNDRIVSISEYLCITNHLSQKKYKKVIMEKLFTLLNNKIKISDIYYKILASKKFKEKNLHVKISNMCNIDILYYEDLIPMVYIYFKIFGYPINYTIKHIVIDEAQDYSLLQFKILKNIFPKASFTILGDINQTINPYYVYNTLNDINSVFHSIKYIELLKSYRSSNNIISYTNKLLKLENIVSIRKENSLPVILKHVNNDELISTIIDDIKYMSSNNINRIAIITKTNGEALKLYKKLKNNISNLSIISYNNKNIISNLVLLPAYISKGLEFDGVIVYENENNLYSERDIHLFYVACTRAQHCLIVYNHAEKF